MNSSAAASMASGTSKEVRSDMTIATTEERAPSHDTILFGNWNGFRDWNEAEHRFVPHEPDDSIMRRTVKLLEQVAELEWSDEWSLCSQCGEALRTQADSYGWEPSFFLGDGEILCLDCADPDSVIEDYENNPRKALSSRLLKVVRPQDCGFVKLDQDFEHGFQFFRELGQTAAGDKLGYDALTAIHWTHRVGAVIVATYLTVLAWRVWCAGLHTLATLLSGLLILQFTLGVANIITGLKLAVAVAHNAGAALLLAALVVLNFLISARQTK